MIKIGADLREILPDGRLGRVVHHHHLRAALGIKSKLPISSLGPVLIGDTEVYLLSQETARWGAQVRGKSSRGRPHRLIARCNHCHRELPAGRFGQHLKIHR